MKKRIQILCLFSLLFSEITNAELPPKVSGENFQRVEDENFIDCQNFRIPKFKNVHKEINKTTCFYYVSVFPKNEDHRLIMWVEIDNITKKTKTGYMNDDINLTL